jgi:MoaA/NifB/PqqE/SkfB family radical SAM enzyme/protein-L-isoaspartate O-methyltransferase
MIKTTDLSDLSVYSMSGEEFFGILAKKKPFQMMHPSIAGFFKGYLSHEKVIKFNGKYVVNTQFPPFPSNAFGNLLEHFNQIGTISQRRLYSVTLGITNRCNYRCWHCYNTGRSQTDISFENLKKTISELKRLNVVSVTLTGGEPLVREDLEDIARLFDDKTFLSLNTTGSGLTPERAKNIKDSGVFAVGISLDSVSEEEHDKLRGKKGAFNIALKALENTAKSGIYPYIIAVASHEFLKSENFYKFMSFVYGMGALEVHLLEPCPTGKLAGRNDIVLSKTDKAQILNYQKEIAKRNDLPILSTFQYLESKDAFGCGAGLTHLYIDGSGEVCPCNLVPISFGNISNESFSQILDKMSKYFCKPRTDCVGQIIAKHIPNGKFPTTPDISEEICSKYLPQDHSVPLFFKIRKEAEENVGIKELKSAYNKIHEYYEEFWVSKAGEPVKELIEKIELKKTNSVFEAGCGTGYATCLLAKNLNQGADIVAVDISEGMQAEAYNRARVNGFSNIKFVTGDALELLKGGQLYDLIFSSWVLGYIPLKEFFAAASNALNENGQLAFIVHKENSPYEQLQIYQEIISQNPSVLQKQVMFDFPHDLNHVESLLCASGLKAKNIWEGKIVFQYESPEQVVEHLLKSGAGTAFYDAIDPDKREILERQFIDTLKQRHRHNSMYEVIHDYISCIATKK